MFCAWRLCTRYKLEDAHSLSSIVFSLSEDLELFYRIIKLYFSTHSYAVRAVSWPESATLVFELSKLKSLDCIALCIR